MGTLKSQYDWSGNYIAGVLLGDSFQPEPDWFGWDHANIPDGVVDEDGNVFTEVQDA